MLTLLKNLKSDFPALKFKKGQAFYWSPATGEVVYGLGTKPEPLEIWSLLHEVGHAFLDHASYQSDFELLLMETAAWEEASKLAERYRIKIDPDHIQDCLDTYRDWLHRRSTCPTCANQSLQSTGTLYTCFNCRTTWKVSAARFCRPYRMKESIPK